MTIEWMIFCFDARPFYDSMPADVNRTTADGLDDTAPINHHVWKSCCRLLIVFQRVMTGPEAGTELEVHAGLRGISTLPGKGRKQEWLPGLNRLGVGVYLGGRQS